VILNNRHGKRLSESSVILFHHEYANLAFIMMMNMTSITTERVKPGKTVKKTS